MVGVELLPLNHLAHDPDLGDLGRGGLRPGRRLRDAEGPALEVVVISAVCRLQPSYPSRAGKVSVANTLHSRQALVKSGTNRSLITHKTGQGMVGEESNGVVKLWGRVL